MTRRRFLGYGAAGGAVLFLPWRFEDRALAALSGTLDPTAITKYELPLVIPPAMPRTSAPRPRLNADYYEVAVRQFDQQILPPPFDKTTVWSYGSVNHPGTFNYPAFTIEAVNGRAVRVKWINDLMDARGHFLPHLLPVDPTLHWANPPGGVKDRDARATFSTTPDPYTGPVPIVTHLHGGENTLQDSDGYPEAWYLPSAKNIPGGYARVGTWYQPFRAEAQARMGQAWQPGTAVFQYENDQRATTLWYHDHTLGMTRLNVYAGPAGFYLVRGGADDLPVGVLPGPAPGLGDPHGTRYYEIPIAIQDRSFTMDGSLFYPDTREFFDEFPGPFVPDSDVPPIWNPEFFGNTMVVNGRTWPYLEVERRRYRFRLLNGCNSRFLILQMSNGMPLWQIGTEGGFLSEPLERTSLLMAPAQRADVVVDFTGVAEGTRIVLENVGPDEPFGGEPVEPADPNTTGQVMQFRVVERVGDDPSTPPDQLVLPAITPLGPASVTRQVSLNEQASAYPGFDGPVAALLGTMDGEQPVSMGWDGPISENPAVGATEVWEIFNFTEDAHPIHVHELQFQVVDRQPFDGDVMEPETWESGFTDTVIAYPEQITRIKARFAVAGLFVWHCHIVEHEDNEMMRPYAIGPVPSSLR